VQIHTIPKTVPTSINTINSITHKMVTGFSFPVFGSTTLAEESSVMNI
jgi:hypothetical protein